MAVISRPIEARHGATVFMTIMQSEQYVEALKKAGLAYATPIAVLAILDTGASVSALDSQVIAALSLQYRGQAEIHTPSTGAGVVHRDQYDATLVIGENESPPLIATIPVIECEFASRGFHALIGRDILRHCRFTYDGPTNRFGLEW